MDTPMFLERLLLDCVIVPLHDGLFIRMVHIYSTAVVLAICDLMVETVKDVVSEYIFGICIVVGCVLAYMIQGPEPRRG